VRRRNRNRPPVVPEWVLQCDEGWKEWCAEHGVMVLDVLRARIERKRQAFMAVDEESTVDDHGA